MASTVIGPRAARPARFFASTNGKKVVMGVTGFILFAFVVGHMMGNMQIYAGVDKFNAYGHFLHGVPELLWIVRIGLLAAVGLHIWASVGMASGVCFSLSVSTIPAIRRCCANSR